MCNRTCSLAKEITYKKGGNNMKTKMKKLIKNQKGMTLIELLAVIVIIAIIALIAIPAIGSIINNSKDKAILSDASQIISSAKIAMADGVCDGSDTPCTQDNMSDYVEKEGITGVEYTVTKAAGVYTLTYPKLDDIKSDKFKTGSTVTSTKLAELMGNKEK